MAENNYRLSEEEMKKALADRENPLAVEMENKNKQAKLETTSDRLKAAVETRMDTSQASNRALGVVRNEVESQVHSAADELWKNVPVQTLPTAGIFYKEGVEITIRPALVAEIRHWSTIDENDFLDMDKKMNFILEKCLRMKDPESGSWMSWKDIKDVDRIYLVFRIHELTFPNGENKLILPFKCQNPNCGDQANQYTERLPIKSSSLRIFKVPTELMKYYSPEERMFVKVSEKLNKTIKITLPSCGVSSKLKEYFSKKKEAGDNIDLAFLKVAPFIIHEWRGLTDEKIDSIRVESYSWGKNESLWMIWLSDIMTENVKLTVSENCKICNEAIEVPLFFRDGIRIKNLFSVSAEPDDLI